MTDNKEDKDKTAMTIFDTIGINETAVAIKALLDGKTPLKEVRKRPVHGGREANFVNIYYMTRQINLLTAFRWTSKCIEEKFRPNEEDPKEIGAHMVIYIWDSTGKEYSHDAWGQKDVVRWAGDDTKGNHKKGDIISFFDDLKAAYSDGIKKCLSYVGIASDVYGNKELAYFEDGGSGEKRTFVKLAPSQAFSRYLADHDILVSKACEICGVKSFPEITDFKAAYDKVKQYVESKS